ncbi:hypothetical protein D3C81_1044860 [compost metagenome]
MVSTRARSGWRHWQSNCPPTWCRRSWFTWRKCRWARAARSSARPCPSRNGNRVNTSSRAPPCNSRSPRSGARCWVSSGSACKMTSSPLAATRCWPPRSFPAPARLATSSCRCAPCSKPANWAPLPLRSRRSSTVARTTCRARSSASTVVRPCRCPTPSNACGSSGRWNRTARPITSAAWPA